MNGNKISNYNISSSSEEEHETVYKKHVRSKSKPSNHMPNIRAIYPWYWETEDRKIKSNLNN